MFCQPPNHPQLSHLPITPRVRVSAYIPFSDRKQKLYILNFDCAYSTCSFNLRSRAYGRRKNSVLTRNRGQVGSPDNKWFSYCRSYRPSINMHVSFRTWLLRLLLKRGTISLAFHKDRFTALHSCQATPGRDHACLTSSPLFCSRTSTG
jgi:hypothetical protein